MDRRVIAVLALLGAAAASAQTQPAPSGRSAPEGRRLPGRLFVSPMGEPFRGGDHPEQVWFANADINHDQQLTRSEFIADAMRFFATLDVNHDGEIGPTEIDHYEHDVLPEAGAGGEGFGSGPPGMMRRGGGGRRGGMGGGHRGVAGMGGGRPGGGMDGRGSEGGGAKPDYLYRASGAGRFGYIATPEPVTAADADLNRSVTDREFTDAAGRRFALLDANGDGVLTPRELPKLAAPRVRGRHEEERPPPPPD